MIKAPILKSLHLQERNLITCLSAPVYQSLNVLLCCNEIIKKLNKYLDFLKSWSQKKQPEPQIEGLILNTFLMHSELLYYIWALKQQVLDYMENPFLDYHNMLPSWSIRENKSISISVLFEQGLRKVRCIIFHDSFLHCKIFIVRKLV